MEQQEAIVHKIGKKINAVMIRIFGASWRTTVYGVMAFLPQIAAAVQTYFVALGLSPMVLNSVTFFFGILTVLHAKDKRVTGGVVKNDVPKSNTGSL